MICRHRIYLAATITDPDGTVHQKWRDPHSHRWFTYVLTADQATEANVRVGMTATLDHHIPNPPT